MHPEQFMRLAIEEAERSTEPLPCGCVIVKDGEVIAKQHNQGRLLPDATAHAEILAVREACLKIGGKDLSGCTVYCSCEPCFMCLTAVIWSNSSKLFFAVPLSEAEQRPEKLFSMTLDEFLQHSPNKLEHEAGLLREEALRRLYPRIKT